jgi:hypothetical protein
MSLYRGFYEVVSSGSIPTRLAGEDLDALAARKVTEKLAFLQHQLGETFQRRRGRKGSLMHPLTITDGSTF